MIHNSPRPMTVWKHFRKKNIFSFQNFVIRTAYKNMFLQHLIDGINQFKNLFHCVEDVQ